MKLSEEWTTAIKVFQKLLGSFAAGGIAYVAVMSLHWIFAIEQTQLHEAGKLVWMLVFIFVFLLIAHKNGWLKDL